MNFNRINFITVLFLDFMLIVISNYVDCNYLNVGVVTALAFIYFNNAYNTEYKWS